MLHFCHDLLSTPERVSHLSIGACAVYRERLIHMLEISAVIGRPISATKAQIASGLPKPTCHSLIQTLQEQGRIEEPKNDGRYVNGERPIRIALLGKSDVDVRRVAAPLLKAAATKFNETVFLARFRDRKVEIIHVGTPDDPARAFIHLGLGDRPMHACYCSKAIADCTEQHLQDKILQGNLQAYTDPTKATREDLLTEFGVIRKQGFADCDQAIDISISGVAAPITIGNIGAIFSVGPVGPVRRFGKDYRHNIRRQLTQLATNISGAIQLCNVAEV